MKRSPKEGPLRIALVLKTNVGGLWVLPHIREMVLRGHQVTVVIPEGTGRLRQKLDELGIAVDVSAFNFTFRPGAGTIVGLWRLRRQLQRLRPDVVHYHLYASALAARFATLGMRVARVHMVAGPLYLDSKTIRIFERHLARLDTVLVAGSEHTAGRYRALCGQRPPVVCIPYGISTEDYALPTEEERARSRRELGLSDDNLAFVMVAFAYAPKKMVHSGIGIKGHDVLLEAWRDVSRERPAARLFLIGGGFDESGEAHRQELIERFGVSDVGSTVQWLSTVDNVRPYYAAADISVCPSLSENHGAAFESTASGVPCIVSDAGALPETVSSDTGWMVPAADSEALAAAMIHAIDLGRVELKQWGLRARNRTGSLFNSAVLAGRLVNAIEGAARTRRPSVRQRGSRTDSP